MNRVLVILNPAAGSGSPTEAIEAWHERRPETELRRTAASGDAQRWARKATEDGCGLVVAAGGDGTVHEVACGILDAGGSGTALGILPLGTGNDLIRSLGVPDDVEDALELLDRGERRPMDAVRFEADGGESRFFVNTLTGGFSGELHDALDDDVKESWGPLSYLRSGLEMWGKRSVYRLEVEVDGERSEHEALNLVVANGAYAGSGIRVARGADPFDGTLDVVLVLDAPALELSGLAANMLTGESVDHDALVRLRGKVVRVRSSEPLPVSVDGEPDTAREMDFQVLPGALSVVVEP